MRYCGVVPVLGALQLVMLEEVRTPEPPIRLSAMFFEPGPAEQVAAEVAALPEVVVAVGAPPTEVPERLADGVLHQLGVPARPPDAATGQLVELLDLTLFRPEGSEGEGPIREGDYRQFPLFETNADGVFCALQGRLLPAKRHPLGMQLRIDELSGDHVFDEGGDLWHRRIEEIDAAACALCAHRYAVGHASWLGYPDQGVVVLPGSTLPEEFPRRGVLPPVERLQLRPVSG